jgi:cobyrinic acid a,c-diamide synthase
VSAPRILLAPTHRTGLAGFLAAGIVEIVGAGRRHARFHHLGAVTPAAAWDRWEGSSFLDPALYDAETLAALYERAVRGADLSVLTTSHGAIDDVPPGSWSPAGVARALDCPLALVLDCRGWDSGISALVKGFQDRLSGVNLAGLVLTGVRDLDHRGVLRRALAEASAPVVGCVYQGDGPGWDTPAPGPWGLPLSPDLIETVHRHVDAAGLETLAGQRGFLAGGTSPPERRDTGPLVAVAAGRGFTAWSRDSIDALRAAGARVRRLDLAADEALPEGTAGLVVAGHLWQEALPELAGNFSLMREMRVSVAEGLPTLALGGGMLYFLRRLQDPLGRTHELAGVLSADGELLGDLDEPTYLSVRAERDTLLLGNGETVTGWVAADAEIMEAPVSRGFPLSVGGEGWPARQLEGAATSTLLCSRVLVHLASCPTGTRRFVAACADYERSGSVASR